MKLLKILLIIFCFTLCLSSCSILSDSSTQIRNYAKINTSAGMFFIGLYEGTPLHRDNFLNNCSNNIYDSVLIYEILPASIISAGLKEGENEKQVLGTNFPNQTISSELNQNIFNKKYAVGMKSLPLKENPDKLSDNKLFYIVYGMQINEQLMKSLINRENAQKRNEYIEIYLSKEDNKLFADSLKKVSEEGRTEEWKEMRYFLHNKATELMNKENVSLFDINSRQREVYEKIGGIPVYDNLYTVFGEISYGTEIIDLIYSKKTDLYRKPLKDIYIISTDILDRKEYRKFIKKLKKESK